MEKTLGAYEARRRFGQLIEEAFYRRDHIIVERGGRPMVAIISIDDYKSWQRLTKERIFELLESAWKHTDPVPENELEADVQLALERLREENRNMTLPDHP
jgi:prevent-host-death family protein